MGIVSVKVLNVWCYMLVVSLIVVFTQINGSASDDSTQITTEPPIDCESRNASCDECVSSSSCYYCFKDHKCRLYPSGFHTLKPQADCGTISDMAWKTCLVKFNTLLIIFGSLGGALLLITTILCCCCCRKVNRIKVQRQLTKWERQRNERNAAAEERRQDRESRREEMRQKYGLSAISTANSNNKYTRFN